METVTVSPNFRVVIPNHARLSLNIQVGQKLELLVFEDRIGLISHKSIQEARGFL